MNDLLIRQGDNRQKYGDRYREWKDVPEGHSPGSRKNHHHLLGGVRRRGEGVRGKHSQTYQLSDCLMGGICGLKRLAQYPGAP
jgi:hypothetical protein